MYLSRSHRPKLFDLHYKHTNCYKSTTIRTATSSGEHISSKNMALKLQSISSASGAATALGYRIRHGTSNAIANNVCSRAAALFENELCRSPLSYHYLHDQRAHAWLYVHASLAASSRGLPPFHFRRYTILSSDLRQCGSHDFYSQRLRSKPAWLQLTSAGIMISVATTL